MLFTAHAPGVFATSVQTVGQHRVVAKRGLVHADAFFGNLKNTDAFDLARCAGEVLVDRLAVQADRFKQLRAAVTHVGADTHFRHDFRQALADGFDVVVNGFVSAQITRQIFMNSLQRFHSEVGMNRLSTITRQHRKVMYFTCRAGFNH